LSSRFSPSFCNAEPLGHLLGSANILHLMINQRVG
jgi:hypothetical protein